MKCGVIQVSWFMALLALFMVSCSDFSRTDPDSLGLAWVDFESSSSKSVLTNDSLSSSSVSTPLSSSLSSASPESSSSQQNPNILVDGRDGRTYKTVTIGDQKWMAENLAYLPSLNAQSDSSSTSPTYYVYGNKVTTDPDIVNTTLSYLDYGVLYNKKAALISCPNGWHLPDESEWNTLLNINPDMNLSSFPFKASSKWSPVGYDQYGFAALPGGYYGGDGYYKEGIEGHWWISSNVGDNTVSMYASVGAVYFDENPDFYGFSVRCIEDE